MPWSSVSPWPEEAYYWVVGIVNRTSLPTLNIELYNANGDIVRTHNEQILLINGNIYCWRQEARLKVRQYCRNNGIDKMENIHYDAKATLEFENE